jgi:hypothetical protein
MTSAKMGLSLAYWSEVHCTSRGGQFTTSCTSTVEYFSKATLSKTNIYKYKRKITLRGNFIKHN